MTSLIVRPQVVSRVAGAKAGRSRVPAAVVLILLGIVALAALPYLFGPYEQQVGYRILQLGALATAWNLLAGYGGLVSLGSAAFVGIGAYTATELGNALRWPLPVLLLAAAGAAAGFAVLVSPAMFRLRGLYFTVGTLALAEALRILMVDLPTFGGAGGIVLRTPTPAAYALYWWALGVAVVSTTVVLSIMATPMSLSLRAVRDDEDVARQLGVFTFWTKLGAFAVSAALIGIVGGLQAAKLGVIEPYGAFGLSWTVDIVAVAIIGGMGTRAGPWIGAVFVVLLAEFLQDYPGIHLAITGAVLIAVIRFAPQGLSGAAASALARLRDGWPGRAAR
jgi:branched-chain amino acid transport system permease protein